VTRIARAAALLLVAALPIPARQDPSVMRFVEAASRSGLEFIHQNGATDQKYLPETMGGGVLVFDYDGDGWQDIFFVNSGSMTDPGIAAASPHHLYRNDRDGTFSRASADRIATFGYGMGACSADIDNDGLADLFVTGVGANRLYRNAGEGRFDDITASAGVLSAVWSSSCAFGDFDNDGHTDLYVANYLDFSPDNNKYCGEPGAGVRIYCDPNVYNGEPDTLFHNNGDGTFSDISADAGVDRADGKGLGVVIADLDDDGWADIYVANDMTPNFLFRNRGNGTFEELGLLAGVSVGGDGRPLSGMGTDAADLDGDGLAELFVTNMDRETHSLYRNLGGGFFSEVTFESGIGTATLPYVGWGAVFADFDNDTDLDLAIANGAVLDNVAYFRDNTSYPQRNLLLENLGRGRFVDVSALAGPGFSIEKVSRGLAAADLDNDGDVDLVVGNNGQAPDLLWNQSDTPNNAIRIRTVGRVSNRDGIGARLSVSAGGTIQVRTVKAGSSYLGHNDLGVHFGLGRELTADRLEVAWPSGQVDVYEQVDGNQTLTILEGGGIIGRAPFY
jgi:hypothetical protein